MGTYHPYRSPRQHLKKNLQIDIFPIFVKSFTPIKPPKMRLSVLRLKPKTNAPDPLPDQHFTLSLKIMTLTRIYNF